MGVTELTDEPCPKCGASLDVRVALRPTQVDPAASDPPDAKSTVRIDRVQVCPECDWQKVL
jgi:ssDNA-binding Zn-finger/Zn-ribbon topoisomerase 1